MVTGKKSMTKVNDHKDGQFSTFGNTVQGGKMQISGNHQFNQFTNNGATTVMPRAFPPKKLLLLI